MITKTKKIYYIPLLLLALILFYAYNDLLTSRQAGFREVARGGVYIFLSAIILLLVAYNLFRGSSYIRKTTLSRALKLLLCWITVVNVLNGVDIWFAVIHFSLGIWWLMAYWFFYNYLSRNPKAINIIMILFISMFCFYVFSNIFIRDNIAKTFDRDNVVTGFSYYLILFIPYISLLKSKKIKICLWTVALLFTITSFKRGPIIILPIMFFIYYYSLAKMKNKWAGFNMRIVLIIILSFVLFWWGDTVSNGFLSSRFAQDELETGSGRTEMWTVAMMNIEKRNVVDFIFGTGSGSSVHLLGTGVHNEWVEFLFSFGLIGVLLYANMCLALLKRYLNLLKQKFQYTPQMGMMIIYVLLVGMFSGMYFQHSTFYIFSFLGIIESFKSNELKLLYR